MLVYPVDRFGLSGLDIVKQFKLREIGGFFCIRNVWKGKYQNTVLQVVFYQQSLEIIDVDSL